MVLAPAGVTVADKCITATWLATLDDSDRIAFTLWEKSAAELHRRCRKAGFTGGLTATKQHKHGRCGCGEG